jgi:transposase
MWTMKNRPRYDRDKLRYPSDLTDEEWSLVEPLIPPAKHDGRRREVVVREVVNGVMYVLSRVPVAIHPEGPAAEKHGARLPDPLELRRHDRKAASRAVCAMPRGAAAGGQSDRLRDRQPEREERGKRGHRIDPPGYDAGKKIKGKKRHILVDTPGLLLHAVVHPADIQDRDGGVLLLSTLFGAYPFLVKLFADAGYQAPQFATAVAQVLPHLSVEIVKRSDPANGFVVLPMRWVVERTLAWLNRCRRLAKDFENLSRNALAFLQLASIRLMLRKLCNPS